MPGTSAASRRSRPTSRSCRGLPPIWARWFRIQAIQVLKHMGFNLVDYIEDAVFLDMPDDIATAYRRLEDGGKRYRVRRSRRALQLPRATLSYPYQPWTPKTIASKRKQESVDSEVFPSDRILPHHEWLARYAGAIKQGRRVLVYAEHTMQDDILQDVTDKITRLAAQEHGATLKVATLRSTTVKPGDRAAWFAQREAEGYNVVLCNRAGQDRAEPDRLAGIVVLEPVYNLHLSAGGAARLPSNSDPPLRGRLPLLRRQHVRACVVDCR